MNWSVLTKDIINTIIWFILKLLPITTVVWLATIFSSDAPLILTWFIHIFVFCWITFCCSMASNAVPALFWRYRKSHVTRFVEVDGYFYRQIKLFGIWFYLAFSFCGETCKLKHTTTTDPEELRETNHFGEYDQDEQFNKDFNAFVNAWRHIETAEVLKYQTFEGGRAK